MWREGDKKLPHVKLSSAGLIYKHFGKEVIANACKQVWKQELSEEDLNLIHEKLYKKLILEIDAIDNGVNITDGEQKYHIGTGLATRVGRYNYDWNEDKDQEKQFKKAMVICEEEFFWQLKDITQSKMPARSYFKKFFDERKEFHPSGEMILFGGASCPWKGTLFELEEEQNCVG